jgi:hypothetical protein
MRALCRIADIPEDGAKGFPGADGAFTGLIVVRQGDQVHNRYGDVYLRPVPRGPIDVDQCCGS